MTKLEKVKEEVDKMPNDVLEQVLKFINSIKPKRSEKKRIHTFKLKGAFDNLNIRKKAYE